MYLPDCLCVVLLVLAQLQLLSAERAERWVAKCGNSALWDADTLVYTLTEQWMVGSITIQRIAPLARWAAIVPRSKLQCHTTTFVFIR